MLANRLDAFHCFWNFGGNCSYFYLGFDSDLLLFPNITTPPPAFPFHSDVLLPGDEALIGILGLILQGVIHPEDRRHTEDLPPSFEGEPPSKRPCASVEKMEASCFMFFFGGPEMDVIRHVLSIPLRNTDFP